MRNEFFLGFGFSVAALIVGCGGPLPVHIPDYAQDCILMTPEPIPPYDGDPHEGEKNVYACGLTKDELVSLKATMWYDSESQQLLVNGKADVNSFSPVPRVGPGIIDIVRLAGPGVKHDIQRALNVRNLDV